ncbi:hypothetical protein N7454_009974 [Penicillium verhagenii]|nr:hypothetical protein N7454_009974 [Penicillium verhagenii]
MPTITGVGEQSRYRLAQEREFYKSVLSPYEYYSSHYAPWDHASNQSFAPQPSKDPALTSYAQLSALRLGTDRALISLFDRTHQYILAEATPTLSLTDGHVTTDAERLQLGCCVFPKERGLCHIVETSHPSEGSGQEDPVTDDYSVTALDVNEDDRFNSFQLLAPLSDVHFYMAVPIFSPRDFRIGSLCVMDSKPRKSPPDSHSLQFLRDMAAIVMDHLEMKETKGRNRRAEKMIVGLGSFVEGRSTLRDSWREAQAQHEESEKSGQSSEGQLSMEQQDMQQSAKEEEESRQQGLVIRGSKKVRDIKSADNLRNMDDTEEPRNGSTQSLNSTSSTNLPSESREREHTKEPGVDFSQKGQSVRSVRAGDSLKDKTLPNSIRNIFSRAANLIRESIGAEGVIFLDANSERFGNLVDQNTRRVPGPHLRHSTSSSDESSDSASSAKRFDAGKYSDSEEHPEFAECLGFSSSGVSSINDEDRAGQAIVVSEPLFTSLIRRYPRGKIFTYNANGALSDSDEPTHSSGSEPGGVSRPSTPGSSGRRRRRPAFQRDADDLINIFKGARNILLLPIWDSDRKRWFAGTLAWTKEPDRIFTFENELVYISAFTNSVMAEIRRVDVEVAEKAKTNLVSSITHELRNPLHGILGTADILSDTAMNALQHGMVHTIESCGRTLLDTINNLLDLTFIDQEMSSYTRVSLDSVLEEVAECVFAGYCFYNHPQAPPPALTESSSRSAGQPNKADPVGPRATQVTVIFDIEPDTEWEFYTHAGAWRRILMNIFGNALKYTSSGYIYLGLRSSSKDKPSSKSGKHNDEFEIILTVKDTGKGIGAEYLQNGVFSPFSQEDPLASGSGLGLSIVHQAVGYLNGSIEIESTQGVGTNLSIHAPLMRPSPNSDVRSSSALFDSLRRHTEDKTIGFLGFGQNLTSQRDTSLYASLDRMCHEWFGMQVTKVSPLEGKHKPFDFYLAVQTELDCEDVGGRNLFDLPRHLRKEGDWTSPVVVVICQSPEEAHSMFVAAKNRGDTTFFEFVSQPCGPRKLARALDMCIKRQNDEQSGRQASDEPTRWVEMPESSHLPVDLGPSDPPNDRMKISKRPTAETIGKERVRGPTSRSPSLKDYTSKLAEANEESPTQSTAQSNGDPNKPAVLLVDDNDLNLQLLCAYAQKDGYSYETASNGAEAVDVYKSHPGKFQAIIIDISMPIMDGFEASRQIRRAEKEYRAQISESENEALPRTIIAALTGLDSAEAQKEALGSGIDTFLIKPIKRAQVQAILRRQV